MDTLTLNPQQKEAIRHPNGPLLIIAGAGTGKTTVITERIKHFIQKKNIKPEEILALTFTEKASNEMEERVDQIMPYGYTQMWISTFHSFCETLLREEALAVGLNPNFRLIQEAESLLLLKQHLFNFELEYYRPLGNPTKFLEAILQHFSRLKDEDISPSEYKEYAIKKMELAVTDEEKEEAAKAKELAQLFEEYEKLKAKEGVMDFSDLISNALHLLRTRKNILHKYQKQFKQILVDEFQDTNFAQNELAILLAGNDKNITVVADDDQAIYRWRGAALSNVIQFKNNFPGAKIITLTLNYRSTQQILDRAYTLIQNNNPNRLEIMENINKKLKSSHKKKGEDIEFILTQRADEEADQVAQKIKELLKNSYSYKDFAILVRANNHAQPFYQALHRHDIPYQFLGPSRLFQQEEIKDLIAYFKVLYDLSDNVSLFRILNMDMFGISGREINYMLNFAKKKNYTLFESLEHLDETFLQDNAKEKLQKVYDMISRHMERIKKDTAGQILYYFLVDTGLFQNLMEYKTKREEDTSQNIARFFDRIKSFETHHQDASVYAIVDWIDLMMQMGESPLITNQDWKESDAVNIMTVHSSKGLEFPIVFLVNLVSDRFPTRERKEKIPIPQDLVKELIPEGDYHLQEERRLFYVGMTRAQEKLILTASSFYGEAKREKKLSPFILETLPEVVLQNNKEKKIQQLSLSAITKDYNHKVVEEIVPSDPYTVHYLSFSELQAFDICPLHYKARYILGIPTSPTAVQNFGVSMHNALLDFHTKQKENKNITEDDLITLLKNDWKNEAYLDKKHQDQMLENGINMLKRYYKDSYAKIIPEALELPFSYYLDEGRKIKVGGKIDRIDLLPDGKIEIIDYKTGKPNKGINRYAYELQLGIYALAANRVKHPLFNKKPEDILITLYYLENGEKITNTLSQKELDTIEGKIMDKVKKIESSDFFCSGSILCENCEYKILCGIKTD